MDGARQEPVMPSVWTRYSFGFVTLGFFVVTLIGHWVFGWFAYVQEQTAHNLPVEVGGYVVEMLRDTFENWQSEFLQPAWQVGGLALLLFVGSPQSKEGTDRIEAKLDAILERIDTDQGRQIVDNIDARYMGRHTDEHFESLRQSR
jgi:hypothetical protein